MEIQRKLIKTNDEFNEMLDFIKDEQVISIDTENGGKSKQQALNPTYCIPAGYSICIKKDNEYYSYYIPINHTDIKTEFNKKLKEVMGNKKIIVMHNSGYDGSVFKVHYDYDLQDLFWFDTAVGQHLIDENNPKGLKKLTKRYLNVNQSEFDFDDISQCNAESVYKYACDDAVYTYMHYEREKQQLKEEGLMDLYKSIEEPFQKVLVHMKVNGINFNVDKCKEIEQQLLDKKQELIDNIVKVTPQIQTTKSLFDDKKSLNINLNSDDDLKKLLYDKLNLPVINKTDKGSPSVDTPTLRKMTKDGKLNEKDLYNNKWLHPILPYLIEFKKVKIIINTFTHSLYEKVWNGKIYPNFNDVGTKTSRLSSSNPNFQQLPKTFGIRNLFEASEGYKMFVPDFSQEELRICGVITKSETFKRVYNDELDLHLKVANDIWKLGIPEECLKKSHPKYEEYEEKFHKDRFNAKSINFGLMYGRTAYGLQQQLGGTEEDCQEIVDAYFETYPEIAREIEKTAKDIKTKGFTRNLFNRKRRFSKFKGKYYTKNVFREAFNYKIQGSCGDILRIVMNKVLKYINNLENPNEVRILGTVHDEIIYEIKDNQNFNKHKEQIKYIMENSVKLDIKLTVDGSCGDNYGEAK